MLKFCSPYAARRREFMVNPGGKAAQRGIKEGDIISTINGESTRTLTNSEAHNLLRKSGNTLKLGLNEDVEGSPKRRQYKTVQHQEIHQETVKKSTTSYTLKETIERSSSKPVKTNEFESVKISESYNGNETCQDGRDVTIITNIPVTQRSTPSTSTASTPSTLVAEGKNISTDQALASRQSSYSNCSSIPDEGSPRGNETNNEEMNDDKITKSKKRRERRKKLRDRQAAEENTKKTREHVQREPASDKLEFLRLKRIEHKYKVESPKELTLEKPNKKTKLIKSKSLDDDDFLKIQELSETSESEDHSAYPNVVVSEASSEENLLDEPEEAALQLTPQEEQALRSFLNGLNLVNSPEESAKDLYERTSGLKDPKAKRLQKRKELEAYFRPIAENPRYLDAISEEASDLSDKEAEKNNHLKQGTPEQELVKVTVVEQPVLVLKEDVCSVDKITSEHAEVVYLNDSSESSRSSGDFGDDIEEDEDGGGSERPISNNSKKITDSLVFSQLTPPPTPDGIGATHGGSKVSFDYTRTPNILRDKEPDNKTAVLQQVSMEDLAKDDRNEEIMEEGSKNEVDALTEDLKVLTSSDFFTKHMNVNEDTKEINTEHIPSTSCNSNKTDSQKLLDSIIKLSRKEDFGSKQETLVLACDQSATNPVNLLPLCDKTVTQNGHLAEAVIGDDAKSTINANKGSGEVVIPVRIEDCKHEILQPESELHANRPVVKTIPIEVDVDEAGSQTEKHDERTIKHEHIIPITIDNGNEASSVGTQTYLTKEPDGSVTCRSERIIPVSIEDSENHEKLIIKEPSNKKIIPDTIRNLDAKGTKSTAASEKFIIPIFIENALQSYDLDAKSSYNTSAERIIPIEAETTNVLKGSTKSDAAASKRIEQRAPIVEKTIPVVIENSQKNDNSCVKETLRVPDDAQKVLLVDQCNSKCSKSGATTQISSTRERIIPVSIDKSYETEDLDDAIGQKVQEVSVKIIDNVEELSQPSKAADTERIVPIEIETSRVDRDESKDIATAPKRIETIIPVLIEKGDNPLSKQSTTKDTRKSKKAALERIIPVSLEENTQEDRNSYKVYEPFRNLKLRGGSEVAKGSSKVTNGIKTESSKDVATEKVVSKNIKKIQENEFSKVPEPGEPTIDNKNCQKAKQQSFKKFELPGIDSTVGKNSDLKESKLNGVIRPSESEKTVAIPLEDTLGKVDKTKTTDSRFSEFKSNGSTSSNATAGTGAPRVNILNKPEEAKAPEHLYQDKASETGTNCSISIIDTTGAKFNGNIKPSSAEKILSVSIEDSVRCKSEDVENTRGKVDAAKNDSKSTELKSNGTANPNTPKSGFNNADPELPSLNSSNKSSEPLDNIKKILSETKPTVPPKPPPRKCKPSSSGIPESWDKTYSNVISPPRPDTASTDSSESSRCTAQYYPGDVATLRELALATLKRFPWEEGVLDELIERFTNMLYFGDSDGSNCRDVLAAEMTGRQLSVIKEEESGSGSGLTDFQEIKLDQRLKARNLSEWLVLARDKSKSLSSLDRANVPINNLRRSTSNARRRRLSLPQEIYEKQLRDIMEKEREIQRELESLEEEKRKLRAELSSKKAFQMDDFYVSKRGDFAEMRPDRGRPLSMPVFPTEFFRQQMYEEYMDKFCEREDRKQHKVIKISSSNDLREQKSREIVHPIEIEREFMDRVKQLKGDWSDEVEGDARNGGGNVEEEPVIVLDGGTVKGVEALPRHLREFLGDLATQQQQVDESIWSPNQPSRRHSPPPTKQYQRTDSQHQQNEPVSPIWTPKSANSSPTVERKEFRPVTFQSPVLSRKVRTRSETVITPDSTTSEPAPWKLPEGHSDTAIHLSSTLDRRRLPTSQSTPGFGSLSASPNLPRAQNPTVTLLQKAREGQLPKGAQYLDQDRKLPNDRPPIKYPGEVLYNIRNEYTSESESEKPRKMADLAPRKFEGVGPVSRDGMPLILRSEVKEKDQSKWYKRMYDTIHKQKPHRDEYITIKYKQKRAQYPYTSGYLSEPEPGAYDSDFTDYRYQTLDRRRKPQTQAYINATSTMPRSIPDSSRSYSSCDFVRNSNDKYVNTPGRIENYRPGHSSISEKEAKQWWDEVMDIFDGHLEQQSRVPPPQKPRSFINQALKDGYESDSTLVFKRKEENAASQISPKEQRDAYKMIQKGGDVPFQGLRKPAPERPKETDLVEFFPISPTLTKIRIHKSIVPPKEFVLPEQQYFCYPASVHNSQKTFANFKRTAPSSAPPIPTPPPSPPKRRSSRNNSTLRLISTMKVEKSPLCKRHETCFTSGPTKVNYLRDKITCKISPTAKRKISVVKKVTASPELKSKIVSTLTTTTKEPRKVHSTTKLYKSGSTGSIVSKRSSTESLVSRTPTPVRTFGSEKKKFDLSLLGKARLPKKQSEDLLSPTEVKKGIKNISDLQYKETLAPLSSCRHSPEAKTVPIKVGITERGKQILRSSIRKAANLSPKSKRTSPTSSPKISTKSDKQKPKVKSTELAKPSSAEICKQKDAIDSSHFFRNLFLRNIKASASFSLPKNSWIVEKTNQLTRRRPSIIEPSIGAMKIYLKHTRPVKDSKFISLDIIRSRSASPKAVTFSDSVTKSSSKRSRSLPSQLVRSPILKTASQNKLIFSQTSRPVSPVVTKKQMLKVKDVDVSQASKSKSPILTTREIQRSSSPRNKLVFSQTSRPVSPVVTKKQKSPILKPKSMEHFRRSPSPQRNLVVSQASKPKSPILMTRDSKRSSSPQSKLMFSQTFRPVSPLVTRKQKDTAQTKLFFSETTRPISPEVPRKSPIIPRSPSCRKIMQLREQSRPQELTLYACPELKHSNTSLDSFRSEDYQVYLKDIDFGADSNKKFRDLNHFYSDIEKVGRLEKTVVSKPRKRCEDEIIDYDRWMEVRTRERAEHELKHLYSHLKEHEKEKGFLFLPKDVERYRWKRELDRGLRIKEKSVENIKEEFEKLKERPHVAVTKDTYKPLWRGNSVINLASILTERRSQSEGRVKTARQKHLDGEKLLNHGIGSRIWSSLSMEQVNNLKKQLQDIYGDDQPPKAAQKEFVVEVPREVKSVPRLTVRRNSDSSRHDLMSEDEKKQISQTLSKEVLEKMAKRRQLALPLVIGKEVLGAKATIEAKQVKPLIKTNALAIKPPASASETESASTDESTKTVINLKDVQQKVEYFEKAKELEYVPTVYKAAEEGSSQSEEASSPTIITHSKSAQNLKEYFGESDLARFATLPLSAITKKYSYTKKPLLRALDISPIRTISEANSHDSLARSRSASPYSEEAQALSKRGEVNKLRRQFELFEDLFGEKKFKRSRSESDLLRVYGHVDDLRRKYEYPVYSGRGRSRVRRGGMVSPVWLRPEDRYMPHINIISKIASLYSFSKYHRSGKEASRSMEELAEILGCPVGEVERMKEKFDKLREQDAEISLMGRMYTSSPNLKELRDITPYLTANWIAHRFPRSEDNTRSLSSPETSIASRDTSLVRRGRVRSPSPVKQLLVGSTRYTKEPDLPPPPPPPKSQGEVRSQEQESPRKYVENEVTIHYKTPVRTEIKEYVSEDELAHRQAEAMKKIYEEERKRKYLQVSKSLQELQDMKSRRHTDNFIPSQKSPISLNRYDDFDDLAPPKLRTRSPEPRLVAKALYNFVGQTARELTFRKGDLIYVRRQVDKNWYEGELNAMVGLFPVNYVEIVPYEHTKTSTTSTRKAHEGQARAKYNFVAQTHLELSLAKGELVTITRKVDDNWFEGKIGGRKGIFPVAYVDVLIDPSEAPPPSSKPVASPAAHSLLLNGSAQGKESMGSHLYTPNITVRDNGYHHAKPVQLSGSGTYSTLPKSAAMNRSPMDQTLHIETQSEPIPYRALYKYTPQNDDELELLEGDTVYVLEKCDDGWYVGSSDRTGAFGTFPGNYVEKI